MRKTRKVMQKNKTKKREKKTIKELKDNKKKS